VENAILAIAHTWGVHLAWRIRSPLRLHPQAGLRICDKLSVMIEVQTAGHQGFVTGNLSGYSNFSF
jgi:hypothetical protein